MFARLGLETDDSLSFDFDFLAVKLRIFRNGRNEYFSLCLCFFALFKLKSKGIFLSVKAVTLNFSGYRNRMRSGEHIIIKLRFPQTVEVCPVGVAPLVGIEKIKQKFNVRKPLVALGKAAPFSNDNGSAEP